MKVLRKLTSIRIVSLAMALAIVALAGLALIAAPSHVDAQSLSVAAAYDAYDASVRDVCQRGRFGPIERAAADSRYVALQSAMIKTSYGAGRASNFWQARSPLDLEILCQQGGGLGGGDAGGAADAQ